MVSWHFKLQLADIFLCSSICLLCYSFSYKITSVGCAHNSIRARVIHCMYLDQLVHSFAKQNDKNSLLHELPSLPPPHIHVKISNVNCKTHQEHFKCLLVSLVWKQKHMSYIHIYDCIIIYQTSIICDQIIHNWSVVFLSEKNSLNTQLQIFLTFHGYMKIYLFPGG